MMLMFTGPNVSEKTGAHLHFFCSQHILVVTDVSELFQCPCPNIKCVFNDAHVSIFIVLAISLYMYQKIVSLGSYNSIQY